MLLRSGLCYEVRHISDIRAYKKRLLGPVYMPLSLTIVCACSLSASPDSIFHDGLAHSNETCLCHHLSEGGHSPVHFWPVQPSRHREDQRLYKRYEGRRDCSHLQRQAVMKTHISDLIAMSRLRRPVPRWCGNRMPLLRSTGGCEVELGARTALLFEQFLSYRNTRQPVLEFHLWQLYRNHGGGS